MASELFVWVNILPNRLSAAQVNSVVQNANIVIELYAEMATLMKPTRIRSS